MNSSFLQKNFQINCKSTLPALFDVCDIRNCNSNEKLT